MSVRLVASQPVSIPLRQILCAVSPSRTAWAAVPYAVDWARRFQAALIVAALIPARAAEEERQKAGTWIRRLPRRFGFDDIAHEITVESGEPSAAVAELVRRRRIDLIVTATRGRHGWDKLRAGSGAEEIAETAPVPVLWVGPQAGAAPEGQLRCRQILLVTDFAPHARAATDYAYMLAYQFSAGLLVLHVAGDVWQEPMATRMAAEPFAESRLAALGWVERDDGVETELLVEFGFPETVALETAAKRSADLIVIGAKPSRYPRLHAHLPGPLAYNIASHSHCPVLTVPEILPRQVAQDLEHRQASHH